MADPWALRMPRAGLLSAGALRLQKIEVCIAGDSAWLRGAELSLEIRHALQALPAVERFDLLPTGALVPRGQSVPIGRLPDGPWLPLVSTLRLETQAALLPGTPPRTADIRLERSEHERPANVLIAAADAWQSFALKTSTIRLSPLKFALADTRALIWGTPPPSIPGERFFESAGIAVPCGFDLVPLNDTELLRTLLGLQEGDLALFREDGSYEFIESALFVPATRSAVRLSFQSSGNTQP